MPQSKDYKEHLQEIQANVGTSPEIKVIAMSADQASALVALLAFIFTLLSTLVGASFWVAFRWAKNVEYLNSELKYLKEEVGSKADSFKASQSEMNLGRNIAFNRKYIESILERIENMEGYLDQNTSYKKRKDIPPLPDIDDIGQQTAWGMTEDYDDK